MAENPYGQRNHGGWCRCSICGRTFGGLTGFDAHRIPLRGTPEPEWRCATDEEIADKGYHLDAHERWKGEDRRRAVLPVAADSGAVSRRAG